VPKVPTPGWNGPVTDAAPAPAVPSRHRRVLRALVAGVATVVVLAVVLLLAGGWYFAGEIRSAALEVRAPSVSYDLEVTATAASGVTLRPTEERPGRLAAATTYGLDWPDGYGQVTGVVGSAAGSEVTRQLAVLSGEPPAPGDPARLLRDAFPDPRSAVGTDVREVSLRSDGGSFPAWQAPGPSDTWAVLTHGRGATRTEMLRLMRATTSLGLPSLGITYRRSAESGGGLAQYGQDEWVDLEAAVQHALDEGARDVVLVGSSMGGAISAAFLESSALSKHVVAVVLDSPMLDLGATVRHGAAQRRLPAIGLPIPGVLTWTARQIAGWRYGLDAGSVDYLDDTTWLTVPALVFHAPSDATVPVSTTRRLAAEKPDLVEHVVVDGADHVESWNVDPAAYERTVERFLAPFAG
jgi:uncharacterized protein